VKKRRIPKILINPIQVKRGVSPGRKTIRPINNRNTNPKIHVGRLTSSDISRITSFSKLNKRNNRLFIIAGGPSVKNVDFSKLTGEDIMCVNASVKLIDQPTYFVTMDYSFLTKEVISIDEINKKITGKSFFILKTNNPHLIIKNGIIEDKRHNFPYTNINKFNHVIASNTDFLKSKGFGEKLESFVNGNNSGFSAIQLGILLGYEEIYLIGFDLGFTRTDTHFHDWYKGKSNIKSKINDYKNSLISAMRSFSISTNWIKKPSIYTITDSPINLHIPKKELEEIIKNKPQLKKLNNDKPYLVVSYYTLNTPYEQEALKLKKSLERLNIPHDIVGVRNLGNWQANTRFKAKFMQDMLIKHKGKSVVWVDSDAVIHSYPKLFDSYNCDVAVRWQDFRWRKNECLSGTIYLANNPRTLELCKRWEGINIAEGPGAKTFEQWNLGKVIEEMRNEGKIKDENLPPEYTMIFDSMRAMYPNITPIIEHFQASRKLKNKL